MPKVYSYPKKVNFNEGIGAATPVTISSTTDGCLIMLEGIYENNEERKALSVKDEALLIVLENSHTAAVDVTVKAGNAWAGGSDLVVSVPASGKVLLRLEGAKYKNVSGEDKGYIKLLAATASKISVTTYNLV